MNEIAMDDYIEELSDIYANTIDQVSRLCQKMQKRSNQINFDVPQQCNLILRNLCVILISHSLRNYEDFFQQVMTQIIKAVHLDLNMEKILKQENKYEALH